MLRVAPRDPSAVEWSETFDGPAGTRSDRGSTAWWSMTHAGSFALDGEGAIATTATSNWRSEPLAASGGLDLEIEVSGSGASGPNDSLRVFAYVEGRPVELASYGGAFGDRTVSVDNLGGASLEIVVDALTEGTRYAIREVRAAPSVLAVGYEQEEAQDRPVQFELMPVSPNPAQESVSLRFRSPVTTQVRVEVFDMLGRRQLDIRRDVSPGTETTLSMNVSSLAGGAYLVRVRPDVGEAQTRSFMVAR